jgi:single-strand DNA-binding protein
MNYNKVIIAGNLTKDVELTATKTGTNVANITIAVNETIVSNGEKQTKANFFSCTAFGKTAENISKYFAKGKPIFIEGRLQQEVWETDGKKNSKTKIVVDKFEFIGNRDATEKQNVTFEKPVSEQKGINTQVDDDIPF